jgi:hypothetical protein
VQSSVDTTSERPIVKLTAFFAEVFVRVAGCPNYLGPSYSGR